MHLLLWLKRKLSTPQHTSVGHSRSRAFLKVGEQACFSPALIILFNTQGLQRFIPMETLTTRQAHCCQATSLFFFFPQNKRGNTYSVAQPSFLSNNLREIRDSLSQQDQIATLQPNRWHWEMENKKQLLVEQMIDIVFLSPWIEIN